MEGSSFSLWTFKSKLVSGDAARTARMAAAGAPHIPSKCVFSYERERVLKGIIENIQGTPMCTFVSHTIQ